MSERIPDEEIRDLQWSIIRGCAHHEGHLWSTSGLSADGMVTLTRAQRGVVHQIEVPIDELNIEAAENSKHAKTVLQLIEFYRSHNKT